MGGLTGDEERIFARYSIRDFSRMKEHMEALKQAWIRGDAEWISQQLIEKALTEDPGLESIFEKLFFQRNRTMADKIKTLLDSGSHAFVVVGAGHLVGDRGIVSMLQNEGLQVQQEISPS